MPREHTIYPGADRAQLAGHIPVVELTVPLGRSVEFPVDFGDGVMRYVIVSQRIKVDGTGRKCRDGDRRVTVRPVVEIPLTPRLPSCNNLNTRGAVPANASQ